ncbi:GNAT family N-acetyltransferase [Asanoa sp. NPDC049573]|uniref:GNAT family N-acetyltransferase n=1 Tax=Asanoa sp. NPDC049573 TaxID=3155396 RepID=UPI00342345CF
MTNRFPPAVRLSGLGITLREWTDADLATMPHLFDDAEVDRWTPLPSPFDEAAAHEYLVQARIRRAEGHSLQLAITNDGHATLGEILLFPTGPQGRDPNGTTAELAYAVGPQHRRQGLTSRAVRLITDYAYQQLAMDHVILRIDPNNAASTAVARSTGFEPTGADPLTSDTEHPLWTWTFAASSPSPGF